MRHKKLRIAVNSLLVILLLISRVIFRSRRKVVYFDAMNGIAKYRITYYVLIFIPVFFRNKTIPRMIKK